MNVYEVGLYLGSAIHVLIWLYVFFGWLLPNGRLHIKITLFLLLPLIYIVQSMPCHAITYAKLQYIKRVKFHLNSNELYVFDSVDEATLNNISRALKWDLAELKTLAKYIKYYELKLQVPKLLGLGRRLFDGKAFANPLSPQGLIVLGFIINLSALGWMYRNDLFGN